jgi:hypothetical protein
MTDAEWTECADPASMLLALRGIASDRVVRGFCAACCRRIWGLMRDERSRRSVEVAERFLAGAASELELATARRDAEVAWAEAKAAEEAAEARVVTAFDAAAWQDAEMLATAASAARWVSAADVAVVAAELAEAAAGAAAIAALDIYQSGEAALAGERWELCNLLRQMVNRPFNKESQGS